MAHGWVIRKWLFPMTQHYYIWWGNEGQIWWCKSHKTEPWNIIVACCCCGRLYRSVSDRMSQERSFLTSQPQPEPSTNLLSAMQAGVGGHASTLISILDIFHQLGRWLLIVASRWTVHDNFFSVSLLPFIFPVVILSSLPLSHKWVMTIAFLYD